MMFWTLFIISAISGSDENKYTAFDIYETRFECEYHKILVIDYFKIPDDLEVRCIKTDEI